MFKNPQVRVITRYSGVRRLALGKINTCFHIKQKLLGRSVLQQVQMCTIDAIECYNAITA